MKIQDRINLLPLFLSAIFISPQISAQLLEEVNEFHQYALSAMSKLITGLNPALNDRAVNHKALHLIALVEGMMVVPGPDKKIAPIARGFENEFRKQALNIALCG